MKIDQITCTRYPPSNLDIPVSDIYFSSIYKNDAHLCLIIKVHVIFLIFGLIKRRKMVVKVYGSYKSVCTLRVISCLIEKDVEYELVQIDLGAGEHKKEQFLARQPFGQVPAIEDGDQFKLFESRAIARYIATKYADRGPDLLGNTPEERAVVDQWVEVEAHNYNDLVFNIIFNLYILPKMGKRGDRELAKECEKKLARVLDIYEERLGATKYLAGETFTMADLAHLPGTNFLITEAGKGYLVRQRKNVSRWWDEITGRSAWKKVLELLP
ncbi:hypothetical protein H6P81_019790 [Aristolochia fimbriata]|uniref:glutathione transferase n=1 Tax=Aristolochia fimbriata TaxID=158543 RepID=A0AAV7DSL9_ARIFI|nr:hypothetical protein H6P81_019790 [Aristolochia fimbriata]